MHPHNAFVTLTYTDDALPISETGLPTLRRKDYQDFLKRLRKAYEPERFRFYLVGEYGDETQRPHYHAALFNFPSCLRGRTRRRPGYSQPLWSGCCPSCELVGNAWRKGDVDLGTLEPESAQYICGYVTKKMTARDDTRLAGREPEFAQPSLKPGIGYDAMHELASETMKFDLVESEGDVPSSLRHGSRILPLGRYLRRTLRTMSGMDPNAPQSTLDQVKESLRPLREAQMASPGRTSFKSVIIKAADQKVKNMESRQRTYKKRKPI